MCFPVNFAKFLRTTFFIEHLGWLLLYEGLYEAILKKSPRSFHLYVGTNDLSSENPI